MPVCSFTLQHAGTPDTLFPVAKRAITTQGGSVTGSPVAGSIVLPSAAGRISLNYTARGSSLAIQVTDKPWVVSCSRIQSELAQVLAKVPAPGPLDVEAEFGEPVEVPRATPRFDSHQTPANPQVEILDFGADEGSTITVPARSQDMTRWLLVAGLGVAAIGMGYYVSKRKRPKHRRRTTKD